MKLVKETIEDVEKNGYSESDIEWVGSKDGKYGMSWDSFKKAFEKIEYDCGYGHQEVAKDLVVVGNGWWLERSEYDGAEGWDFKSMPVASKNQLSFDKILGAWDTLHEIQIYNKTTGYLYINDGESDEQSAMFCVIDED